MHYEIYKNARDASWRFLLQHKICSLPVDLRHITSDMGIIVKKDDIGTLGADERGLNQLNKAFLYSACQITIAVIVNLENPVADLTVEQIAKLYMGEITN